MRIFPEETDLFFIRADQVNGDAFIGDGLNILVMVTMNFSVKTSIDDLFSVEVNNIMDICEEKNDHGGKEDDPNNHDPRGGVLPRG